NNRALADTTRTGHDDNHRINLTIKADRGA
ncbi:MAG: hypothetical protein ACJAXA_001562, partial [Candidatus Aldehydirespiratoraceae bacterium]